LVWSGFIGGWAFVMLFIKKKHTTGNYIIEKNPADCHYRTCVKVNKSVKISVTLYNKVMS